MTTDRRVLIDGTGQLGRIVDGLHDVVTAIGDRRFAIVGGIEAGGVRPSLADVADVWQAVVEPHLDDLRR